MEALGNCPVCPPLNPALFRRRNEKREAPRGTRTHPAHLNEAKLFRSVGTRDSWKGRHHWLCLSCLFAALPASFTETRMPSSHPRVIVTVFSSTWPRANSPVAYSGVTMGWAKSRRPPISRQKFKKKTIFPLQWKLRIWISNAKMFYCNTHNLGSVWASCACGWNC